jgi:hypothetical protein
MHLRRTEWMALVDGEIEEQLAAAMWRHLEECPMCGGVMAAIARDRETLRDAFGALDTQTVPSTTADDLIAARPPIAARRRLLFRIAAALTPIAAAAAIVVPSSPLHRLIARDNGPPSTIAPARATPDPNSASAIAREGIGFVPTSAVQLDLHCAAVTGLLQVTLVDAPEFRVTSAGAGVRYRLGTDAVSAELAAGVTDILVQVPRALVRARVQACGRQVFTLDHGVVTAPEARVAHDVYVIPLVSSLRR